MIYLRINMRFHPLFLCEIRSWIHWDKHLVVLILHSGSITPKAEGAQDKRVLVKPQINKTMWKSGWKKWHLCFFRKLIWAVLQSHRRSTHLMFSSAANLFALLLDCRFLFLSINQVFFQVTVKLFSGFQLSLQIENAHKKGEWHLASMTVVLYWWNNCCKNWNQAKFTMLAFKYRHQYFFLFFIYLNYYIFDTQPLYKYRRI